MRAFEVIQNYYHAFNEGKMELFFSLLSEGVIHEINQGGEEIGKGAFQTFMERMNRHYKERAVDLSILANSEGTRASAEFFIEGTYLATDAGLPPARGQTYRLRCGAFFELERGKITRVTNYYNLQEWLRQVQ